MAGADQTSKPSLEVLTDPDALTAIARSEEDIALPIVPRLCEVIWEAAKEEERRLEGEIPDRPKRSG